MKSQSSQKVIQIGSSIGVTIPAREARYHGIKPGQKIRLTVDSQKSGVVVLRVFRASWWQRLFQK